jgi:carbohydrate diacid regulator
MSEQFQQIAQTVTERMAELLSSQVTVIGDRGMAIASSQPDLVGLSFDSTQSEHGIHSLQVPIRFNGQVGKVLVSQPTNGEVISPRLAQVLVELMIDQTVVVTRLPNQHELKHKFIHDLLQGSTSDEADILREGQILGMDLTRPRAVILIDAADYILASTAAGRFEVANAQVWRRSQLIISSIVSFFHLPSDTICAYIGNGEVAVLKASSTQDLVAWTDQEDSTGQSNPSWANLAALKRAGIALLMRLRCDTNAAINIGIGRYHPGIQGLARSYQDARAALSLGRRFHGQNQVHCLDQLGIAAFVGISDESTKIDLAKHLLSPLDQEFELLETLDAFFFENCGPSQAANRLCIHRNTLSYRLDKITSLTGLDPRRFDDAMQIRLALLLQSLQGDSTGLCRCPTTSYRNQQYLGQMSNASLSSVIQHRQQ